MMYNTITNNTQVSSAYAGATRDYDYVWNY